MKYTQIPANTFGEMQMNAGVVVDSFDPATGEIGNIIGATTGGLQFQDSISYTDLGEDVDNCPKNVKELKAIDSREITLGGTLVTLTPSVAKRLVGAADVDANDASHIIPRRDLSKEDFKDLWWVGDYSDKNTGASAGFVAIHMMNTLNTGGFQFQSTDKAKGQFAFTFTAHFSMAEQELVPYEIYIKGDAEPGASIVLDKHSLTIGVGDEVALKATVVPSSATVTWSSSASGKASVADGVVTGEEAGSAIITASITVDGVAYTDTCTVIVEE